MACEDESNCGAYDYSSNSCGDTPPSYSTACTDYNNFKKACNDDTSNGTNSTGCVYDESDDTCGDKHAACSSEDGNENNCNSFGAENCRWKADSSTCVETSAVATYSSACSDLDGFRPECLA